MEIKPLADRVLVKPAPVQEKTVSGIIIPDSAKEKPLQGEVVATGTYVGGVAGYCKTNIMCANNRAKVSTTSTK